VVGPGQGARGFEDLDDVDVVEAGLLMHDG
jgi:hypothetical protein